MSLLWSGLAVQHCRVSLMVLLLLPAIPILWLQGIVQRERCCFRSPWGPQRPCRGTATMWLQQLLLRVLLLILVVILLLSVAVLLRLCV